MSKQMTAKVDPFDFACSLAWDHGFTDPRNSSEIEKLVKARDAQLASPLHTKIAAQEARIGELENALLTARESIELFERVLLPKAESWMLDHGQQNLHPDVQKVMPLKFGEWTHYANTLRMIKATLQGSEVEG